MKLYVARDKGGVLILFGEKPHRNISKNGSSRWDSDLGFSDMRLPSTEFPFLTWEDEPLECRLITAKNWVPAILPEGLMKPYEINEDYSSRIEELKLKYDDAVAKEKEQHLDRLGKINDIYLARRKELNENLNKARTNYHSVLLKYLSHADNVELLVEYETCKMQMQKTEREIGEEFVIAKNCYSRLLKEEDNIYNVNLMNLRELKFKSSKEISEIKNQRKQQYSDYINGRKEPNNE